MRSKLGKYWFCDMRSKLGKFWFCDMRSQPTVRNLSHKSDTEVVFTSYEQVYVTSNEPTVCKFSHMFYN